MPNKFHLVLIHYGWSSIRLSNLIAGLIEQKHVSTFQGFLCELDAAGIRSWTFTLTVDEESELTESGKLEHFQLGQRYKERLPTLMGQPFDNDTYQVDYTVVYI